MEQFNGGEIPKDGINYDELQDFIIEVNGEYHELMSEEEEHAAYLAEYINKNIDRIKDILEEYPGLLPGDMELDQLSDEMLEYFLNFEEEVDYPPSKKNMYIDNVMSILKTRDHLENDTLNKTQNELYARETLSDLLVNTVYTSKEKLQWLEINEYVTGFNPMNLGPELFDQELDYLIDIQARLSEDYYYIYHYLSDLKTDTAKYITEKYGNPDLAIDIAEEIVELIRPIEDIFRVDCSMKTNPKEFKTLRYQFFDYLNNLELDVYDLAENYIDEGDLSILITNVGDEYIKFLSDLSEIENQDEPDQNIEDL